MYTDVQLQFTLGKEKFSINYANGVFQGDNASPILFLFIMMATTDSFTMSFKLKDKPNPPSTTFLKKGMHTNKMVDSKTNAPVQKAPPLQ